MGGPAGETHAADPAPGDPPLLVATLQPRLRQPPPPEDFSQFVPLGDTSSHLDLELAPEDSWRLLQVAKPIDVSLPRADFAERDADRPRLTTSALDANDQRSVVGGRLLLTRPFREASRVETEARLLWLCEFIKSDGAPTAFFAPGTTNVFATQGFKYGSNWAMLGTRVRWQLKGGLSAFAGYDAQVNSLEMFHVGSTGFGYNW